jgi:hypothetical protein
MKFKVMTAIFALALIAGTAALTLSPSHAVAAGAVSVVGRINGGGTSIMTDIPASAGGNISSFGIEATLFSDGSARGHFDCVDHMGDPPGYPGNVFGDITSWSRNTTTGAVTLQITGKFVAFPGSLTGGVVPISFAVTIQTFGGAGVGHWTLDVVGNPSPFNGGPICQELLISGQIVERRN